MNNSMKNWFTSGLATVAILGLSVAASAQVPPPMIQYQGTLLNTESGEAFTGTADMLVRFGTEDGSVIPYTENIEDVAIDNGLFSITIGMINPVEASVFLTPDLFLHLTVTPDGADPETFTPVPLTSMPYAHVAATAVSAQNIADDGTLGELLDDLESFLDNSAPSVSFSSTETYSLLRNQEISINFNLVGTNVEDAVLVSAEGGFEGVDYDLGDTLAENSTLTFQGLRAGNYVLQVQLSNAAGTTDVTVNLEVVSATAFTIPAGARQINLTGNSRSLDAGDSFTLAWVPNAASAALSNVEYRLIGSFTDFDSLASATDEVIRDFQAEPSFTFDAATSENDATYQLEVFLARALTGATTTTSALTFGGRESDNNTTAEVTVNVVEDITFNTQLSVSGESSDSNPFFLTEDAFAGDNITLVASAAPAASATPYTGGDINYIFQREFPAGSGLWETLAENTFGSYPLGRVINDTFEDDGSEGNYRVVARNDQFLQISELEFDVQTHLINTVPPPETTTIDASLNTQLAFVTEVRQPTSQVGTPSVQWQSRPETSNNPDDWADIPGATSGDLAFIPVGQLDELSYRLVATTDFDTLVSNSVQLDVNDDVEVVFIDVGPMTSFSSGGDIELTLDVIIRDSDLSDNAETITAGRIDTRFSRAAVEEVIDPSTGNVTVEGVSGVSFSAGQPARTVNIEWYLQVGANDITGPSSNNPADELLTTGSFGGRATVTNELLIPGNNNEVVDPDDGLFRDTDFNGAIDTPVAAITPAATINGFVRNRSTLEITLAQPSLNGRSIYAVVSTVDANGDVLTREFIPTNALTTLSL